MKFFVDMPLNRTYTGIINFETKEAMDAWMAANAPNGRMANGEPAEPMVELTYAEWRERMDNMKRQEA